MKPYERRYSDAVRWANREVLDAGASPLELYRMSVAALYATIVGNCEPGTEVAALEASKAMLVEFFDKMIEKHDMGRMG